MASRQKIVILLLTLAGLTAIGAGAAAFFLPEARAFLSSHYRILSIAAGLAFLVAAALSMSGVRALSDVGGLEREVKDREKSQSLAPLQTAVGSGLSPLVAGLNRILEEVQTRESASLEIRTSNRLLAHDLARWTALMDKSPFGLVLVDAVENIVFANAAGAPFLSVSPSDARGRKAAECLSDSKVREFLAAQHEDDVGDYGRTLELAPDPETGRGFYVVSRGSYRGAAGAPAGQILVFEDVSHSKNVEKIQTEFVNTLAAELRAPLSSIRSQVEQLTLDGSSGPDETRDTYNAIDQEALRMTQLIENFLTISMMECGGVRLNAIPTRLRDLIEECLEIMRPQCESKEMRLLSDLPDRLPVMNLDEAMCRAGILNILGNAVKYTPEGGSVTVSARAASEGIVISIRDTGIGISDEDLPRVFDKFFRSKSAQARGAAGSGIGLASAQQIVRLHGGDIRVSSKKGSGSEFAIMLPRSLICATPGE
ncbi:hypothetical protein JW916_01475 [Candidatus Sumerlaeota bacterium]|nr:hypothetical protein [Candidatus Sumerlaeota bacterium]